MVSMGKRYVTRLRGCDVVVVVLEIEQDINNRHRGKWVVRNEETGRRMHRTSRQLRAAE